MAEEGKEKKVEIVGEFKILDWPYGIRSGTHNWPDGDPDRPEEKEPDAE